MPVRIPDDLPAAKQLEEENIFVMTKERAFHQDIRELHIAVLNLMPTKMVTETQLLRLLGNTPLQTDIRFIRMTSHDSVNTPPEHLDAFYEPLDEILDEHFDGLVITGAPVETLPFEEVDYWSELVRLMDWSTTHVWSTLHICWGAQAGLYHHYGVGKRPLPRKMFGLFRHKALDLKEPLLRGFDEEFLAPHSRHTEVCADAIAAVPHLKLLAVSEEAGVYLVASQDGRRVFVTGHPEYDRLTLKAEYDRDLAKGLPIAPPVNYFPGDDPAREPLMTWRAHAHLLYANWLNYCVYQETPYDLDSIGGPNA
ncbi:homoserine transsuccinylase [uncultured spirochete]|uniref:Homoserine O-acetyltransferase n=1 Tax=uncultured spirochete TaxID=156406 RepID=A0A3P3XQH9_9SPIR|nr:homoserine transsuccinylase [uncultured spirochete]